MKATIEIFRLGKLLMSGTIVGNKIDSLFDMGQEQEQEQEFVKDLFNIEMCINNQGQYRCHIHAVEE